MSVYARDILSRLPQLLATCTAIFGDVLKIDSTKKVCKKLQGIAAGSASWCTVIILVAIEMPAGEHAAELPLLLLKEQRLN